MNNTAAAIHSPLFLPSFFSLSYSFVNMSLVARSLSFSSFFSIANKKGRPLHRARDRVGKVGRTAPSRRPIFAIF